MFDTKDLSKIAERALLLGAYTEKPAVAEAESLMEELAELVDTLGIPVLEKRLLFIREIHPRHFIGSGKAAEIVERAKELGCDIIIFDNELSPSQQRNWEELSGLPVIDRTEVILDIFARRAQSREARLQIELARLEHALPRLTGAWGHLVRQGGGIGARGEGETQLEQDKRRIRGQIDRHRRELQEVRSARATQRKDRKRAPAPNAAIVGYTNAGKSSLLRHFTGADVLIEDKLFATLDTTTRKVALPNKQPLLLTDTVGFVRKLPHQLVESFNATLEEAVLSDFLIHLIDASAAEVMEFYNTTVEVLAKLGAGAQPTIVVFNKIDKITDPAAIGALRRHFPDAQFISLKTGEGLPALLERMDEFVSSRVSARFLRLPQSAAATIARIHRNARVVKSEYIGNDVVIEALLPERMALELAEFLEAEPAAPPDLPQSTGISHHV